MWTTVIHFVFMHQLQVEQWCAQPGLGVLHFLHTRTGLPRAESRLCSLPLIWHQMSTYYEPSVDCHSMELQHFKQQLSKKLLLRDILMFVLKRRLSGFERETLVV
eukprot:Platyproteum_vivax@DN7519_c0_g2_i1.p1